MRVWLLWLASRVALVACTRSEADDEVARTMGRRRRIGEPLWLNKPGAPFEETCADGSGMVALQFESGTVALIDRPADMIDGTEPMMDGKYGFVCASVGYTVEFAAIRTPIWLRLFSPNDQHRTLSCRTPAHHITYRDGEIWGDHYVTAIRSSIEADGSPRNFQFGCDRLGPMAALAKCTTTNLRQQQRSYVEHFADSNRVIVGAQHTVLADGTHLWWFETCVVNCKGGYAQVGRTCMPCAEGINFAEEANSKE
jgi:hypothetical protein